MELNMAVLHERLQKWMDRAVEAGDIPFGAVSVSHMGKDLHVCSGIANDFTQQPATPTTIGRFYSMTKIITSFAVMMLYERGLFQLTDPLERYLPSFSNMRVLLNPKQIETHKLNGAKWKRVEYDALHDAHTVPAKRPITIKHLLIHTSGLTYSGNLSDSAILADIYASNHVEFNHDLSTHQTDLGLYSLAEMCDRLAQCPLLHQPGKKWGYSFSTDVLGRLVEVWSGSSLRDFFKDKIFAPLQMEDTDFWCPPEKSSRLASCFVHASNKAVFDALPQPPRPRSHAQLKTLWSGTVRDHDPYLTKEKLVLLSGGGGLVSTVSDYAKFGRMLLRGGVGADGQRLLSDKTLQYMMHNHLPNDSTLHDFVPNWLGLNRKGQGFGLGGAVVVDAAAFACNSADGEFSWNGAVNTVFWLDRTHNLSVVFHTQMLTNDRRVRRELRTLVYGALCRPPLSRL